MINPKISIIVPVYNAKLYLQRCIDSILRQTFKDYEAIFIDDGSFDNSLEILKYNQSLDDRIKIIVQENSGTGEARNTGLKNALGKYIAFMDVDDTIEEDILECMYYDILQKNADIVICEINKVLSNGKKIKHTSPYNRVQIDNVFSSFLSFDVRSFVFGKLYNKELFIRNNIFFTHGLRHNEDNAIVFKLVYAAKKISFIDKHLYNWHVVENSKSNSISKERLDSMSIVSKDRYNFLIKNNIYEEYKIYFYKSIFYLVSLRIDNIVNFNKTKFLTTYIESLVVNLKFFSNDMVQMVKQNFPDNYFKLLNSIVSLNHKSLLLNYFLDEDIIFLKYYSKQSLGLLQSIVDNLNYHKPEHIYIYGAGGNFVKLKPYLQPYKVLGIIDKQPDQEILERYTVVNLEDIFAINNATVVITSIAFAFEMKEQIQKLSQMYKKDVAIIYCYERECSKL